MTGNNANLNVVNIMAYKKGFRSEDIERQRNFDLNQGP